MSDLPVPPDPLRMTRTATLRIALDPSDDVETRAAMPDGGGLPITFSSTFPVERYDWWADERYLEVLEHAPDAIDLSRARDGLPFVDTHNIESIDAQLGRVRDIQLRADGRLTGRLVLSQRQKAQDYARDLRDGLVGEVSVGYRIDPRFVEREAAGDGLPVYRIRKWTPHEVSAVPVPADPSVGVGRSMTAADAARYAVPRPVHPIRAETVAAAADDSDLTATIAAPQGEERAMPGEMQDTAPTGASVVVTRAEGESPEQAARVKQLAKTAEEHGISDVFSRGMAAGQSPDEISREMFSELRSRTKKGPQYGAPVTLTEKEERQYSLARAILQADSGESGFEREVSEDIAKRLPVGYKPKGTGLFIPTNLQLRVALEAGTTSLGGAAVFTQFGGMIDFLRNATMVMRAGASLFPGLSAPVSFVKQTGTGTAYWVDETPSGDVTESNMTFGTVSLTPKTLQATQAFSRQVLLQAQRVVNLETKVREDLVRLHALAIDAAALTGTGTLQPLGAVNNTNLGLVTLGTHGAVPTYEILVDQEVQVRSANVTAPIATLTTPGIAGRLKKTQQFASTNGVPVWTGGLIEGVANGAPAYATNQVPANLTKGTSTTICHAIITAAWRHLLIGEFGAAEIITDPYAQKKKGLIEVTSFQMVDLNVEHDGAFSVIKDARLA
jgi:HK97 family phage major capsid protein